MDSYVASSSAFTSVLMSFGSTEEEVDRIRRLTKGNFGGGFTTGATFGSRGRGATSGGIISAGIGWWLLLCQGKRIWRIALNNTMAYRERWDAIQRYSQMQAKRNTPKAKNISVIKSMINTFVNIVRNIEGIRSISRSKMPRTCDVRVSITKMFQMDIEKITATCYAITVTHLSGYEHGQFERIVVEVYER